MQYKLLTLFGFVTVVAIAVAGMTSESEVVRLATLAVLIINGLGFCAGLFMTHTLKFPRDGSYRYEAFIDQAQDESLSED